MCEGRWRSHRRRGIDIERETERVRGKQLYLWERWLLWWWLLWWCRLGSDKETLFPVPPPELLWWLPIWLLSPPLGLVLFPPSGVVAGVDIVVVATVEEFIFTALSPLLPPTPTIKPGPPAGVRRDRLLISLKPLLSDSVSILGIQAPGGLMDNLDNFNHLSNTIIHILYIHSLTFNSEFEDQALSQLKPISVLTARSTTIVHSSSLFGLTDLLDLACLLQRRVVHTSQLDNAPMAK